MTKILHRLAIGVVLVAGVSLSACSSSEHSEQESFAFTGATLHVINDNANMPVTVTTSTSPPPPGQEVRVEVRTSTVGKSPKTPAWSLTADTLALGTPCGAGWVGYCEGSFSIAIPKGIDVTVNGQAVPVD